MLGYKPSLPHLDSALRHSIVERIVAAVAPEKIVLFGSRARGTHRPESDIDLLVVQASDEPRYVRSRPIYAALSDLPFEVDTEIIVFTPGEVREWSAAPTAFVTTAIREGTVLYER